ncbi:RagB/SusD family nutrient uptake outer membrane protein [Chitinophaga qingshengii]|uniref:RagB/SusD family nutrient uptake outer membrane protein n=1 Tax=Chitinophaga qingshengii TaxID=1569794 RepID=A0ABR7TL17_9BACT|nr:RagB/SusD family nutrient uptake outer membrane protein [Chitinophaga qingshengii]MBC9930177.1 RagB/SusD family nutrient uptake outer membrane protein [Chitinophaga qingshengii]
MKKISCFIFVILSLTSCKKFLNETDPNNITLGAYFKTQNDFDLAVNGAYAQLRGLYNSKSAWTMGEMRSDNTHYDYKSSDQAVATINRYNVADFLDDKYNNQTPAKWNAAFGAISAVNVIIDHIDDIKLPDANRNLILGQVKFIRALSYFDLVRFYGGVPIYKHAPLNREETYIPRASVQEVYDLIIADATDAAAKLDAPAFPQTGRATKGAALTLLGDVYLHLKKYDLAEQALKQVTAMGYSLFPNYGDAFALGNKNGRESVFEIQFNTGLAVPQANTAASVYNFLPRMANTTVVTGVNFNSITDVGGFNTPTQDLISAYETGDLRLDASVGIAEGTFNATDDFTATAVKSSVNYTAPAGKVGRPFPRKFLHTHAIGNQTNDDWPVYRYAEVLLLLAESLNQQGKSGDALTYLNNVRERAFGNASHNITTADQATLQTLILKERRVELAFENKRWLDLVRTGNAIKVMTDFGIKQKALYPYLQSGSYNVTQNRLLFPIPNAEMLLNDKLTQNPEY